MLYDHVHIANDDRAHNLDHSSAGTRPRHQPIGLAGQRKSSGDLGGRHGDILAQAYGIFFLVAGLSADMGVYRNSTMIRGAFILFYPSQKEEGMPCLGYLFSSEV